MDFSQLYRLKDSKSIWTDVVWYVAWAFLVGAIVCYGIFTYKIYLEQQKLSDLNKKIAVYGSAQEKAAEAQAFAYKKEIDDFSVLVNQHKISSNVFTFIEQNTLPNVWFSNFDVSETQNQVNLSGETDDLDSLSQQVSVFENNKQYVNSITVLSSQIETSGKVQFVLDLSLNPNIFNYQSPAATSSTPSAAQAPLK